MTSQLFWTALHLCWWSGVMGAALMTLGARTRWIERVAVGWFWLCALSVVAAFACRILIDIWGFK